MQVRIREVMKMQPVRPFLVPLLPPSLPPFPSFLFPLQVLSHRKRDRGLIRGTRPGALAAIDEGDTGRCTRMPGSTW